MLFSGKCLLVAAAALTGAGILCQLCLDAGAQSNAVALVTDTATVRLHISGMTCGSCPATARLALRRLPGLYGATVALADSLGVVTYDPRRVGAAQIVAHLAKLTDYRAKVLKDFNKTARKPDGA